MLYLEDFLEVVENVPREVLEKTDEIRELDIKVQSTSEQLEEQLKTFYSNAKRLKPIERSATFDKIKGQYYNLLESADEKVNIATSLHDSLERYIRRIDTEIEKFKCELEADSPGITEILERKSLELDEPSRESQKENRSYYSRGGMGSYLGVSDWRHSTHIKKEDSDPNLSSSLSLSPPASSNSLSYTLGHLPGAGGNAIAAAASQAIAATQQMRPGRRTASLAASFDAVSQGVVPADLSIGSELAEAAKAALAASSLSQDSGGANLNSSENAGLNGLSVLRSSSSGSQSTISSTGSATKRQKKGHRSTVVTREPSPQPSDDLPQESILDPLVENNDWPYDPNEPRYCICNQVSYGNMVACDNRKCPLEWFHYACVGITAPPKGKWFCPQCSVTLNRRQRK